MRVCDVQYTQQVTHALYNTGAGLYCTCIVCVEYALNTRLVHFNDKMEVFTLENMK